MSQANQIPESFEDKIARGAYKVDRNQPEWRKQEARLFAQFRVDALAETDLTNHPKADRAFDMAWDERHSSGYMDVFHFLWDLADLMK